MVLVVITAMMFLLSVEGKCIDERPLLPGAHLLARDEEEEGGEGEEVEGGSHGLQDSPALPSLTELTATALILYMLRCLYAPYTAAQLLITVFDN